LLADCHCRVAADPGVDLVKDHGWRTLEAREDDLQRQHRAGQLATGRDARQGPHWLARGGGKAEFPAIGPARSPLRWRQFHNCHLEDCALHTELPELALYRGRQSAGGGTPRTAESACRARGLGLEIGQTPFVLAQQLLVPLQPIELGGSVAPKGQHRLLGVTVLAFEACEGVEPVVDNLETAGLDDNRVAQRAYGRQRLVHLHPRRFQCLERRGECRFESTQLGQHARGTGEPCRGGGGILLPRPAPPRGAPPRKARRVSPPPPLRPKLLFLPRGAARTVELGHLEPQEILALCAVSPRASPPLEVGASLTELRKKRGEAFAARFGIGE